jgi:hypothetical protein
MPIYSNLRGRGSRIQDLQDVSISSLANDDVLAYNATTGVWYNTPDAGGISSISSASDVTLTAPSTGQGLKWDSGTSKYINGSVFPADLSLDAISDVVITSATTGQVLRYNGSNFVNAMTNITDLSDYSADGLFTYSTGTIGSPARAYRMLKIGTTAVILNIEIGDWDMDTNASPVASDTGDITGSPFSYPGTSGSAFNQALILQDSTALLSDLYTGPTGVGDTCGRFRNTSTGVYPTRVAAMGFDTTTYNDTSFNRGWYTVVYFLA